MGIENVARAMCLYQQEHQEGLRPVFIGKTGGGKTTGWKEIADEMKMPYIRLLFSQQLPEDIGGWPSAGKSEMKFLLMEELARAVKEPCFVCADELDKVRPDTMSTLLTLFYEKAIRNFNLHPKTVLVGAMQPVNPSIWLADETGKAISARMTFLPISYRWKYIEDKFKIQLPHLHKREGDEKIILPTMPATPRTVECTLAFLRSSYGIRLSKEEKNIVLYGTLAKQDAEVIEGVLNQTVAWVNPVETAKVDASGTVKHLDVHTITQQIGPLVEVLTPKAWQEVLEKVWLEGSEEDAKEFLKNCYEYLKAKCEASPNNQIEVFGTAEAEEIVKATNAAAENIGKVWKERAGRKEKK